LNLDDSLLFGEVLSTRMPPGLVRARSACCCARYAFSCCLISYLPTSRWKRKRRKSGTNAIRIT